MATIRVPRLPSSTTNNTGILIAVLGVTGAGKSTFINRAAGSDLEVGHTIRSCTDQVSCVKTMIDGKSVTLIDTPGFDDTNLSDADVLSLIAQWLSDTYQHGMLLNGIILLQPVDGNRAYGSELRRTRLFREICGPGAFGHVVIGTTMWSKIKHKAEGHHRVRQRREDGDFWANLVNHGAQIMEHQDTRESALRIIRTLINKKKTSLQIQEELVQSGGSLFETTAAQQLFQDLGEISSKEKDKLNKIYQEMRLMRQANDKYQQDIARLQKRIDALQQQKWVLENQRVKVRSTPPDWMQAVAALGTVAVGAATVVVPFATGGACTIM